jgi:hypothetical protein
MLIIIDKKSSAGAKRKLASYGDLLELETNGITYPAISGHPDIFFCQSPGRLIVAPNLPKNYFDVLAKHGIDFIVGELPVGPEYPASARYNAVATDKLLIHNFRHTDFSITRTLEDLQPVHVDQGYCRCSLLSLRNHYFITSDRGIMKVLKTNGQEVLYVDPAGLLLEGFANGFIGGCCGVMGSRVFINGSLDRFAGGGKIREFLQELGYDIIELTDSQIIDIGSLILV